MCPNKCVDDLLKLLHNLGLRLKKYEVSAQKVQCEWFML